jgi:hypothetical protein
LTSKNQSSTKEALPKWEWGEPAKPSAEEQALSEIEHALQMLVFSDKQSKLWQQAEQIVNSQLKKDAS